MQKLPFLFMRLIRCTPENGLKPTAQDGNCRQRYIVILAACCDWQHYNSSWMDNADLGESKHPDDMVFLPDVDITENIWVYDSDDSKANHHQGATQDERVLA